MNNPSTKMAKSQQIHWKLFNRAGERLVPGVTNQALNVSSLQRSSEVGISMGRVQQPPLPAPHLPYRKTRLVYWMGGRHLQLWAEWDGVNVRKDVDLRDALLNRKCLVSDIVMYDTVMPTGTSVPESLTVSMVCRAVPLLLAKNQSYCRRKADGHIKKLNFFQQFRKSVNVAHGFPAWQVAFPQVVSWQTRKEPGWNCLGPNTRENKTIWILLHSTGSRRRNFRISLG